MPRCWYLGWKPRAGVCSTAVLAGAAARGPAARPTLRTGRAGRAELPGDAPAPALLHHLDKWPLTRGQEAAEPRNCWSQPWNPAEVLG